MMHRSLYLDNPSKRSLQTRKKYTGVKEPDTEYIPLTRGKYAKVDPEDVHRLMEHNWWMIGQGDHQYAIYRKKKNDKESVILMHRFVMNYDGPLVVDHINGDTLDNRKRNLQICTTSDNCKKQRKKTNNTSGYRGVHFDRKGNKWVAQIGIQGKRMCLGRFTTPEAAAKEYNAHAIVAFGKFAVLNTIVGAEHA